MKKKVVVLGAGIGGLTSAVELLKAGYDVTLIEKNSFVGGLCSGYYVDGRYIDACIHWLMGTKEGTKMNAIWQEIGALDKNTKLISLPTAGSVKYDNTTITFYRDKEKTKQELLKIAPEDTKQINKFFKTLSTVDGIMTWAFASSKKGTRWPLIKSLFTVHRFSNVIKKSRGEYASKFKNLALRFALTNCQAGYNNAFFFFELYSNFLKGNADIPSGGALYMVERIKDKFLSLGGRLLLDSSVEQIIIEDDRATGVKINNKVIDADIVVSSIDPFFTLDNLLDKKYHVKKLEKMKKNINIYQTSSCLNVYITVDKSTDHIDIPTTVKIGPIKVGNTEVTSMAVRPYRYEDEYFRKDNKTTISLFIDQNQDDYLYWSKLSKEEYKKEMDRCIQSMIEEFYKAYPDFKGEAHYLSHFGPLELNKLTNTSFGALQSFSFMKGVYLLYDGRIKGLKNVYLATQWNRGIGGTPTAMVSAHHTVKIIKKEHKLKAR